MATSSADFISDSSFEYQIAHINDDRSLVVEVLAIVGAAMATVAVALRLWSRRIIRAPLKADDWTIILSLFLMYGLWGIILRLAWKDSLGKHEITLPLPRATETLKLLYVFQILYQATYPTIKISILLLYRRVFALSGFQLIVKYCIAVMVMWEIATVLVGIFWCTPIDQFWDLDPALVPNCVDESASYIANASINIFTDLVILVLPMPIIWNLHIPRKQKLVLCGIFVLGSLVFIITIFRIWAFFQIDYSDRTWTFTNSAVWTLVEIPLSILCACLPTMRPLVRGLLSSISTASSSIARKGRMKGFNSKGEWTSITDSRGLSDSRGLTDSRGTPGDTLTSRGEGPDPPDARQFEDRNNLAARNAPMRSDDLPHAGADEDLEMQADPEMHTDLQMQEDDISLDVMPIQSNRDYEPTDYEPRAL